MKTVATDQLKERKKEKTRNSRDVTSHILAQTTHVVLPPANLSHLVESGGVRPPMLRYPQQSCHVG